MGPKCLSNVYKVNSLGHAEILSLGVIHLVRTYEGGGGRATAYAMRKRGEWG